MPYSVGAFYQCLPSRRLTINFEPPVGIEPTSEDYKSTIITFILRRHKTKIYKGNPGECVQDRVSKDKAVLGDGIEPTSDA